MPLKVLFDDRDLLIVCKPSGVLVGDASDASSLEMKIQNELGLKVFPFHRLDLATSGIVVLGKSRNHAAQLSQDFEEKKVRKSYLAVVQGRWDSKWNKVENFIYRGSDGFMHQANEQKADSRPATTTFRLLVASDSKSLVEALPKTGRTHQIRLHCASLDRPILGDTLYSGGSKTAPEKIALHAWTIKFRHPASGETLSIKCEPDEWKNSYLEGLDTGKVIVWK